MLRIYIMIGLLFSIYFTCKTLSNECMLNKLDEEGLMYIIGYCIGTYLLIIGYPLCVLAGIYTLLKKLKQSSNKGSFFFVQTI